MGPSMGLIGSSGNLEMAPSGNTLVHWGYTLKGDCGLSVPHFLAMGGFAFPYASPVICAPLFTLPDQILKWPGQPIINYNLQPFSPSASLLLLFWLLCFLC